MLHQDIAKLLENDKYSYRGRSMSVVCCGWVIPGFVPAI
jgi:hypothetical protein